MKYKGWLILTIILGFFYTPFWILSIVIAILGIYADKKKVVVKSRVVRRKKVKRKVRKKPKKRKKKR